MDDLKLSYTDQGALVDVVKQLNDAFRSSKKELAKIKGDIHEYLGLTINFSEIGKVILTMYV